MYHSPPMQLPSGQLGVYTEPKVQMTIDNYRKLTSRLSELEALVWQQYATLKAYRRDLEHLNLKHRELIELKENFKHKVDTEVQKARIQQRQQDAKVYKHHKESAEKYRQELGKYKAEFRKILVELERQGFVKLDINEQKSINR